MMFPNEKIDMTEVIPTLRQSEIVMNTICTKVDATDLTLCQQDAFQEAAFVSKFCGLFIACQW